MFSVGFDIRNKTKVSAVFKIHTKNVTSTQQETSHSLGRLLKHTTPNIRLLLYHYYIQHLVLIAKLNHG